MKKIVCELCGSNDIVKEGSYFVCQYCGTKYSLEEAKALFDGVKVDASGSTIKIENTEKKENLYNLARRARFENNIENAAKHYNEVIKIDPDSWEANFYSVYYSSLLCTISQIESATTKINNSLVTTIALIKKSTMSSDDIVDAILEITSKVTEVSLLFVKIAYNHYLDIAREIRSIYRGEMVSRCINAIFMQKTCGDLIYDNFDFINNQKQIDIINRAAVGNYKSLLSNLSFICRDVNEEITYDLVQELNDKIVKYYPEYKIPNELKIFSKVGSIKKWLKNN